MTFQHHPEAIIWRLHLSSAPADVYRAIDSDEGRAGFWAESAVEDHGSIEFVFINGMTYRGEIVERSEPRRWSVEYFGSMATFLTEPDGEDGTDLTLINTGVDDADKMEVTAGWLNVLLPMKAWVDHGLDLRSHDRTRTWDQGYVDQ